MNFFNKYKDLFGVSNNTPIPQSKLTINNNLFIDKPFVPTYQQTLSINSKLRDLKKDYNDLEQEIQSINNVMKAPKRASSRKGKQVQQTRERDKGINISSPNIQSKDSPFLKHHHKLKKDVKNERHENQFYPKNQPFQENQVKDPFSKKRMPWLKDDQVNLIKHTEMNYVFNHKIKQQNERTKNLTEFQIPRAQNFMFGTSSNNQNSSRVIQNNQRSQVFRPANRNKIPEYQSSNVYNQPSIQKRESNKSELDRNEAIRRRQQAKRNIKTRRQKLGYLYRTSW